MGTIKKGGGGCICPESTLLKALINHLVLYQKDRVIMDMEAGIEHLGRGTAQGVDRLVVVVEPGQRSIETAAKVRQLTQDIGLHRVAAVGSKVRNAREEEFLQKNLDGIPLIGILPFSEEIAAADLENRPPSLEDPIIFEAIEKIAGSVGVRCCIKRPAIRSLPYFAQGPHWKSTSVVMLSIPRVSCLKKGSGEQNSGLQDSISDLFY